jgi:hypothetical protein
VVLKMIAYHPSYLELSNFWIWLTSKYPKDAYTEIRLMGIKNESLYKEVQQFAKENPDIIMKKNSQFFIQSVEQLFKIIEYNKHIFVYNSKVCYSLNPRFMVNNDIAGDYEHMKMQDKIYLDIEKTNHEPLSFSEKEQIADYTKSIIAYLDRYNLYHPTIISSGNGIHVIYKIRQMDIDEGRKEGYKEFIKELQEKMNTDKFHIDAVVDFSRTTALPETLNPKNGYKVNVIQLGQLNDYYIHKKIIRKKKIAVIDKPLGDIDIRESLAWKILMIGAPAGDRNNLLVFYIKLLIRDADEDYREYERELNQKYHEGWHLNTSMGIQGKKREFGLLVNYCKKNSDFCKNNNINYKEYKY